MKQKTDGRVVRLLAKHLGEGSRREQWFLVAIGDDDKARDAVREVSRCAGASC